MPDAENKLSNKVLSWITGLTAPMLIVVLSILWAMGNTVSANAADASIKIEVLKTRTDQMERAIFDIKTSVNQISESVQSMNVNQSTHNTMIELKLENLCKELEAITKQLPNKK